MTWQIDPFGHAAVQASLLGAESGFDALFFGRSDYQDRARRTTAQELEMVWRGSSSLGSSAEIFTGAFLSGNYGPPPGFDWGEGCAHLGCDPPVCDNPELEDYNVPERVEAFVRAASAYAKAYKGSAANGTLDVMFTIGSDFWYAGGGHIFTNMDKIIEHVNADGRVEALYSTPSQYVAAKAASGITFPLKTHDFFPYSDAPYAYWTGYFTSRPALKAYVRKGQATLQAARQLEFATDASRKVTAKLDEAVSVAQHHDGVSGTSKQHVADDYVKRIAKGIAAAEEGMATAMAAMAAHGGAVTAGVLPIGHGVASASARRQLRASMKQPSALMDVAETSAVDATLSFCNLRNVSSCDASAAAPTAPVSVVVYNPTGWDRKEVLRVPVGDASVQVTAPSGDVVTSQVVAVPAATVAVAAADGGKAAPYEVAFEVEVPPLATATYLIHASASGAELVAVERREAGQVFSATNGLVTLDFDATGRLAKMSVNGAADGAAGLSAEVKHDFVWYNSSDGNTAENHGQAGGAYIFRPNSSTPLPVSSGEVSVDVQNGPLLTQVTQTWGAGAPHAAVAKGEASSWVSCVWRLHKGAQHAQMEWTVGPIPHADGLGKEVVSRLDTSVAKGVSKEDYAFWTDSAGRDAIERRINWRPDWVLNMTDNNATIAGNYYPIGSFLGAADDEAALYVVNDRAQSGGSVRPGLLEVMVHRRLQVDDARGVGEPLNETRGGVTDYADGQRGVGPGLIVRGEHSLILAAPDKAARSYRLLGQLAIQPLVVGFGEGTALHQAAVEAAAATTRAAYIPALPGNVQLLTLQEMSDSTVLVRLAHVFASCADATLSDETTVDLSRLFPSATVRKITETTLTTNRVRGERERETFEVEGGKGWAPDREAPLGSVAWPSEAQLSVRLVAMEIRTFVLELAR